MCRTLRLKVVQTEGPLPETAATAGDWACVLRSDEALRPLRAHEDHFEGTRERPRGPVLCDGCNGCLRLGSAGTFGDHSLCWVSLDDVVEECCGINLPRCPIHALQTAVEGIAYRSLHRSFTSSVGRMTVLD
jgi:hypothetical protein